MIDADTMNESYSSSDMLSIVKNRVAVIPFNIGLLKSNQHLAEIFTQINLILTSSLTESPSSLEAHLHELGVLSLVSSSPGYPSTAPGLIPANNSVGLISRVWQLASKMKQDKPTVKLKNKFFKISSL